MTPTDSIAILLSLGAGLVLGIVFFGGLWLTVRKGTASSVPALWFFGSFVLRTAIAVAGFYFIVAGGHFTRLVAALIGFVIMRFIIMRWTRQREKAMQRTSEQQTTHHGP